MNLANKQEELHRVGKKNTHCVLNTSIYVDNTLYKLKVRTRVLNEGSSLLKLHQKQQFDKPIANFTVLAHY